MRLETRYERFQMKLVQMRRQLTLNKNKDILTIVNKIMKKLHPLKKKYAPSEHSPLFDEINRRFDMLTHSFVMDCVTYVREVYEKLQIEVPTSHIIYQTIVEMRIEAIVLPEIGQIQCEFVQNHVAKIIARIIAQIKNEKVRLLRKTKRNFMTDLHQEPEKTRQKRICKRKLKMRRNGLKKTSIDLDELQIDVSNKLVGKIKDTILFYLM